ncbi:hypothetical protein CSA80_01715 [Candidatus Saccharibacteria bacterium]|nr:MAG: hypothetical protein CSA80_01715 [Candidatus Saccharibacteria bacterium]
MEPQQSTSTDTTQPGVAPSQAVPPPQHPAPQEDPGKTMGVISIILSFVLLGIVGLPLAIFSIMKSRKAMVSPKIGVIGSVLSVLSIVASIFVIMFVLTTHDTAEHTKQHASESNSRSSSAEAEKTDQDSSPKRSKQNPSSETEKTDKSTHYDLDNDYSAAKLYWGVTSPRGWDNVVLDKNGVNQFKKPNTETLFTTSQLSRNGVAAGQSDSAASQAYVDSYIAGLKRKGATATIAKTGTITVPFIENSDTMELYVAEILYTINGKDYRMWFAVRFTSDAAMTVQYAGRASDVSESEWKSLIDGLRLTTL